MSASTPPRVLALPGSLRRDSFNRRLLDNAVRVGRDALRIEIYADLASVPLFDEDLEATGLPHGAQRLSQAMAAADGVLIATPEYNQALPGVLKNALDWLSRVAPEPALARKPVAVLGASAGRWCTRLAQADLRRVLGALEAYVLPAPTLYLAEAAQRFDASDACDAATERSLHALLDAFARWIAQCGAPLNT